MNRIILAYAPENAALAESIDRQLSRIGIPFEHVSHDVARQLASEREPVLLLVTDNFLINRDCMEGLLPVLQRLATENRLVAVLADGINAEGVLIPTQIDRMANALHYMKFWQDEWLALSDHHQHAEAEAKAGLTAELDATRGIANEMGEIISTLRDAGYLSWQQFEADEFELFFQKFNLQDWHGQYKRLAEQSADSQVITETPHLPETPVIGGLLAPEPVEDPLIELDDTPPLSNETKQLHIPIKEEDLKDIEFSETDGKEMKEVEHQAAHDAWFWIEKGHAQRGLELFQMALEQYPDSDWLRHEYERAAQQLNVPVAETEPPTSTPTVESSNESEEAKSYDLMGDMALERGDYLFAKYCWDRVVEIDPSFHNIYRKLGLMTAEHLRDYRETAAIYLRKALEFNGNDKEVTIALGELSDLPESPHLPDLPAEALAKAGSLPTEPSDTLNPDEEERWEAGLEDINNPEKEPEPVADTSKIVFKLVLITGATSGIGRATAELFARNGYRLILTGRRVERLVELKNLFEAEFNTEVLLLPFDVRDPGAVEAALANLPESFQEIDILVNNAGLAKGLAPIHEGNLEHWETMIDTNVKGMLYVTRLISQGMVSRRRGHIINVGSSAGKETYPSGNVYCATKFAVDALTRSMRMDLYTHNIRVSQVSPGHVEETEFAINRFDGDAERASIYNDFQPLKSSDVADAIYFMATRPAHVNIQDLQLFATQQASSMIIDRSGR